MRGGLFWYHASLTCGALVSGYPNINQSYSISLLPFTSGICAIASLLGIRLLYPLPTIQVLYIMFSNGFNTFWKCSGLELLKGPLDERLIIKHEHEYQDELNENENENVNELMTYEEYVDKDRENMRIQNDIEYDPIADLRNSRNALWDKIYQIRKSDNQKSSHH